MNFLDRIDWKKDDGVFIPMLNDVMRNRFYESIIKDSVLGKHCIDIGFGTGMLSLLALKHGASHVTAYEKNSNRFLLGQAIIDQLKLQDKITLINEQFDHTTPVEKDKILISESVGTNLWSEGMFSTIPRTPGHTFLPGKYFLELFVVPVSETYLDTLTTSATMHSFFAPGIDLDQNFVQLINQFLKSEIAVEPQLHQGIKEYSYRFDRTCVWGWSPFLNLLYDQTAQASYVVDVAEQTISKSDLGGTIVNDINYDIKQIDLQISISNSPSMILPRVGLQHGNKKLYLDQAESWDCLAPVFVYEPINSVNVTHNYHHGLITYSSKD